MSFLFDERPQIGPLLPEAVMGEARTRFLLAPDIFIQPVIPSRSSKQLISTREVEGAPFSLGGTSLVAPHLNGITALGMCQRIIMNRLNGSPQEWRYPLNDLFNAFCDAYLETFGIQLRENHKAILRKATSSLDGNNIRVQNNVWEDVLERAMLYVDYEGALRVLGALDEERG